MSLSQNKNSAGLFTSTKDCRFYKR